jgi:hypothetical protein
VAVWIVLAIPVDRDPTDLHLELRELTVLQAATVAVGMVGVAAASWLSAEHGPWSWFEPVRAAQRYAAMASLGLATVAGLYAIVLLFR